MASTLKSEPTAPIEDGWLDAASGLRSQRRSSRTPAPHSARLVTPRSRTPLRTPNPPRPCRSNPIGRRLWSLSGEPWPDYGQQGWDTNDEEIQSPPTTNFVATVNNLTDMLDFDSENIDGMDDDVGGEEEPPPTGRRTPTSSYDIYMVDAPKDDDEEQKDAPKACSLKKQSKRRRFRTSWRKGVKTVCIAPTRTSDHYDRDSTRINHFH